MNTAQQARFDALYRQHLSALKRQGKADKTIDVYARALKRLSAFFDDSPEHLTQSQLEEYFDALVKTHSWSTVKVDRNGLQFFYQHVLKRAWTWVNIVKPPKVRSLPDILCLQEIERLINGTRELRYQNVQAWLKKHPRFVPHFVPTSSSWLNLVERWFGELTSKRIRRGVFLSVPDLIAAIEECMDSWNNNPKPFVWTATVDSIVEKLQRCRQTLEGIQPGCTGPRSRKKRKITPVVYATPH